MLFRTRKGVIGRKFQPDNTPPSQTLLFFKLTSHNDEESVAAFEAKHEVQVPENIAALFKWQGDTLIAVINNRNRSIATNVCFHVNGANMLTPRAC